MRQSTDVDLHLMDLDDQAALGDAIDNIVILMERFSIDKIIIHIDNGEVSVDGVRYNNTH